MNSTPVFDGPLYQNSTGTDGQAFVDFYFVCRVEYPFQMVDDGARFNVTLTYDQTPGGVQKIANSSALNVVFTSADLRGNIGKAVSGTLNIVQLSDRVVKRGLCFN